MGEVLQVTLHISGGTPGSSGAAEYDAVSAATDVWITSDILLDAASVSQLITDQQYTDLIGFIDSGHLYGDGLAATSVDNATVQWWTDGAVNGPWGNIAPLTWYTVEFHNVYTGTRMQEVFIDGVSVGSITLSGQPWTNIQHYHFFDDMTGSGLTDGTYNVYFRNAKIGTSRGGNDIFDMGTLTTTIAPPFSTASASDIAIVGDPAPPLPPSPPAASGVYIAFGSDTLSTDPNYVGILGVQAWNTDRGRQYELDKTQAGTAVVTVFDQTGFYDPSNSNSPLFGLIGPLAPAQIRSVNPVTGVTEPVFTGFVESWDYVLDISERWYILTINLTDAFELLARAETVPDSSGTTILAAETIVEDRIRGILADYGWPAGQELIFSGNVGLQESVYNPQTSLLSVLQDCADAELPNAANIFMDKWGQWAFRGRFSRLIPQIYGPRIGGMTPPAGHQAINFWEVGDRNAAETFGIAPIAAIEWTLDLKNVMNACICSPNGIAQADIAGQLVDDPASISQYGVRVLSIPDLLTANQVADPSQDQPALGANDACKVFGQYYVDNYAQPVEMISHIEFHTRAVSDSLAAPLWAFICGVEIGDVVKVWTTNPGGGGFRETQFFIEGIHNVVQPLESGVFDWTMTLDMTPRAWYSKFDGTVYFGPAPPPVLSADFTFTE